MSDAVPERGKVEAAELRRLYDEEGATPLDILDGEPGKRWISETCAGDAALARKAFLMIHPEASFVPDPFGRPGDVVVVFPNPEGGGL